LTFPISFSGLILLQSIAAPFFLSILVAPRANDQSLPLAKEIEQCSFVGEAERRCLRRAMRESFYLPARGPAPLASQHGKCENG
jgi:hypothetical protein